MKVSLRFNSITLMFGSETVLDDLSFGVAAGEKAVVAGPSGSGKSSILNMVSGFVTNYSGQIEINGELLSEGNIQKWRSHIAWLPQMNNIGEGTVREVLLQPFRFAKNKDRMPQSDAVNQMLKQLKMEKNILDKPYRDISGGQQQRIGIAVAALMKKPLMLLDEPTTALDDVSKQAAIETLLSQDATILSTSHDQTWISACQKVIKL